MKIIDKRSWWQLVHGYVTIHQKVTINRNQFCAEIQNWGSICSRNCCRDYDNCYQEKKLKNGTEFQLFKSLVMNSHHFTSPGIVRQDCGDNSYFVEDSVGDLERIWREDIITDQDDASHGIVVSKPIM